MKITWQIRSLADHLDSTAEICDELAEGARSIGETELADQLDLAAHDAGTHGYTLRHQVMKLVKHDDDDKEDSDAETA
jgi:hypothetical protein